MFKFIVVTSWWIWFFPRKDDFPAPVKWGWLKVIVEPTAQGEKLARSEVGAGCSRLDHSLVSPGKGHELDLAVGPFYEKMGLIPFLESLPDGHVLAAQRMRSVSDAYRLATWITWCINIHTS